MKKYLIFLLLIFSIVSVFAQKPAMKFYLIDGSSKQYNLEDIGNIVKIKNQNNYLMSIFYLHTKTDDYQFSIIDSLKFETDINKNNNFIVFSKGTLQTYKAIDIDSIVFSQIAPKIESINPQSARIGDLISISGTYFSTSQVSNFVTFNGIKATNYSGWSDSLIILKVPVGVSAGNLFITVNGIKSNEVAFSIVPYISQINPVNISIGDTIRISGNGFGEIRGSGFVKFNSLNAAEYISWNDTEIKAKMPAGATSGKLYVSVNSIKSNEVDFTVKVITNPKIISINPNSAKIGDYITISGKDFGDTKGTNFVSFNDIKATKYTTWSDNEILVKVPANALTGKVSVTVSGTKSNERDFTVIPQIGSIVPTSAKIGDEVYVSGSGFGTTQGTSFVTFGTLNAVDYTSWNDSEIKVKVPAGAVNGKLSVTVNGLKSNETDYKIIPQITNISPTSGKVGDEVVISGMSFGKTRGTSIVSFGNANVTSFTTWTDTEIRVLVPSGVIDCKLSVTVNGQKSNEINFFLLPIIASIEPNAPLIGEIVTISGSGFRGSRGSSYVTFNLTEGTEYANWADNEIKVRVPIGTTGGKLSVTVNSLKSNEVHFTITPPPIFDTIVIGTQVWMSKNLNLSIYRNGDAIPQVTDPSQWAGLTTGAWCYYNNNSANGTTYGKLYNWFAVNDPRGLAPAGWHIASDAEWSTIIAYLGGINIAGGKLKETGTVHWVSPNTGATDERLFTALPGGYRYYSGGHFLMGSLGYWWTSTESDISNGSSVSIGYDAPSINRNNYTKRYGFSVRCVRD